MIIEVFHGVDIEYGPQIYCPAYIYKILRKKSCEDAFLYAQELLESLQNFDDRFLLQKALDDAQTTSIKSPFISTSQNRNVARSFALNKSGSGYIYTISGPEKEFYNFNRIRELNNLPPNKTFHWMEEMGIPIEVKSPFRIEKIEKILGIKEDCKLIFENKGGK